MVIEAGIDMVLTDTRPLSGHGVCGRPSSVTVGKLTAHHILSQCPRARLNAGMETSRELGQYALQ